MLIQAYQDDKVPHDAKSMDDLFAVLDAYETCTFSPAEYSKVASAAFKWLHSSEDAESSVSILHIVVGQYLFRTGDLEWLSAAVAHVARTSDMETMADILQEASRVRPTLPLVTLSKPCSCCRVANGTCFSRSSKCIETLQGFSY